MNYTELNQILKKIVPTKINEFENITLDAGKLDILHLRDILLTNGIIIAEDLENKLYSARIYGGFKKRNPAYLVLHLEDRQLMISIYAKEGVIKQHTCKDVIYELKESLKEYI